MENMINIDELIKNALKSKDKDKLKAYRNIKSEFLKYKTSGANKEITEDVQIQIFKTMVKNLKKSEESYLQASRQDLVDECIVEREVIQKLIPRPADAQILKLALLGTAGVESDPTTGKIKIQKKNMGAVIKNLKAQYPYNDGKEIANLVKQWIV